jgi:hypothetical protein
MQTLYALQLFLFFCGFNVLEATRGGGGCTTRCNPWDFLPRPKDGPQWHLYTPAHYQAMCQTRAGKFVPSNSSPSLSLPITYSEVGVQPTGRDAVVLRATASIASDAGRRGRDSRITGCPRVVYMRRAGYPHRTGVGRRGSGDIIASCSKREPRITSEGSLLNRPHRSAQARAERQVVQGAETSCTSRGGMCSLRANRKGVAVSLPQPCSFYAKSQASALLNRSHDVCRSRGRRGGRQEEQAPE